MNKLLLVIDVQKSFINENTEPYIKEIQKLIDNKEEYILRAKKVLRNLR